MEKKPEEVETSSPDLAAREKMLDNRTVWMKARESAVAERDSAIADREELLRLREAELEARREADAARAEREHLLVQLREMNEKLVLASLQAHALVDAANAARAAADDNAMRFSSLVKTSSSLVWRATAEGRVEVDRDAWRKLTGEQLAKGEWSWLEAVPPVDRERVREAWIAAVAAKQPYACRHRLHSRKGGSCWVLARAVPIVKNGVVREWIGMMTDVSDHMRVEEAREQFIAILGHDLRNPLTSIVGGIDLLRDLPDPHARTVARMGRSAHRIETIVRDLLDFARGRLGGGIPIAPRACDMRLICEVVVEEIGQPFPSRVLRLEASGDLHGEWDSDRIEQVVSNLVGNAIQHGEDPILVTCRAEPDRVITAVSNRGAPIPEAVLPTLFDPFTRAAQDAADRCTARGGLGLGLYIANEIVHAHGGTLEVTSAERDGGEGTETVFTFALPRSVPRRRRHTTAEEPIAE